MVGDIINIVLVILGAVSLVGLAVFLSRPDHQRDHEDAAREFYDVHGRWPDEHA
jgi:hypothetical protein